MKMENKEKLKAFLTEYELLCKKYDMGLSGCSCCGSPWLSTIDDFSVINNINYNVKLKQVFINGNGFWHEAFMEGTLTKDGEFERFYEEKTIEDYFKEM